MGWTEGSGGGWIGDGGGRRGRIVGGVLGESVEQTGGSGRGGWMVLGE